MVTDAGSCLPGGVASGQEDAHGASRRRGGQAPRFVPCVLPVAVPHGPSGGLDALELDENLRFRLVYLGRPLATPSG